MARTIYEFVRWITARANAHQHVMRGITPDATLKYIARIVADNDVVIGLFPAAAEPRGVGAYLLKGRWLLQALSEGGIPEDLHYDAVPCAELEHAIAAEWRFGDEAK